MEGDTQRRGGRGGAGDGSHLHITHIHHVCYKLHVVAEYSVIKGA